MIDLRTTHWSAVRATLQGKRLEVYDALLRHGPCTGRELAAAMGWDKCSVRPRLCELRQSYHVRETGERRNGEHIMEALSEAEARYLWEQSQPQPASVGTLFDMGTDPAP